MDHWRQVIDNLPFIGLMASDQRNRPYITRLMEQATPGILVGLMVAALGVWRSDSIQDNEISNIHKRVDKNEKQIDSIRIEIQTGFREINDKIEYRLRYQPLPNYSGREKNK